MFEAKAEAEAKALRPRPRPRPKFWPRGHFGLEDLTSLVNCSVEPCLANVVSNFCNNRKATVYGRPVLYFVQSANMINSTALR